MTGKGPRGCPLAGGTQSTGGVVITSNNGPGILRDPFSLTRAVAAVDTALHGVKGLEAADLQLRCGVDSSAPVATVVPHLVRSMCRRARGKLPRPLWNQACAMFMHFMADLTRNVALDAACPHRDQIASLEGVHTVNRCPRCCTFAHIFKALRAEMIAAAEVCRNTPAPTETPNPCG